MLEVGCQHGPGGDRDPGLTEAETRSHFGAWCIVSSPLTLSHDVTNETVMDAVWPVISNKDAIAINQAWHGHSGTRFAKASETVVLGPIDYARLEPGVSESDAGPATTPAWQYLSKPINDTHVAVLLMNGGADAVDLKLTFGDVPGLSADKCRVYDVWARAAVGDFSATYTASGVASHDAAFLIVSAADGA